MKLKLYRDKVISVVRGKDLVGVYVKYPHWEAEEPREYWDEVLLAEMSPEKADKIIKLWNSNK
jgi:hypothetical protein